jgi:membrane protease YdiL (CAAX protease family)
MQNDETGRSEFESDTSGEEGLYEARIVEPSPLTPFTAMQQPGQPLDRLTMLRQSIDRSVGLSWVLVVATTAGSMLMFLIVSVIAAVTALLVVRGGSMPTEISDELIGELMANRAGFVITILVPQLSLLVLPIAAGMLIPGGPRKALRLVRGDWPWWGWVSAVVATPLIGTLASLLIGPFVEESESLRSMTDAFRHHGETGFLLPVVLLIGITPSICEEILFRGFLQPRLTRLMPAWSGVVLASIAFAAMHVDPVHVIGVIPLGLWLGFLSYKSRSLFPAMLAHLTNNALSVVSVLGADTEAMDAPELGTTAVIMLCGLLGMVGVALACKRSPS